MVMDLLESCIEPVPKTHLFRQANMNFDQGETYLDLCVEEDLVRRDNGAFVLSDKGEDVVQGWQRVAERVGLFEDP